MVFSLFKKQTHPSKISLKELNKDLEKKQEQSSSQDKKIVRTKHL